MKRYYRFLRFIKPYTPLFLIQTYRLCYKFYIKKIKILFEIKKINKYQSNYSKIVDVLKKKEKIKVAFFLIHNSVWKYDLLFKLFQENSRYEPFVVICPYIAFGEERMIEDLKKSEDFVKSKKYPYYITYNFKTKEWLDVNKELFPDIIFYTNPWKLTKKKYYINNFRNVLNCYVPYFYQVTKHLEENFGGEVQNLSWKVFYESEIHLKFANKYSKNKAKNVIISGYPGLDELLFNSKNIIDPWKIKNREIKRIIWAPHHTISGQDAGLGFSNFERYANYFKELIENLNMNIQIAFKPHPILKSKLYQDNKWGKEKTDSYYEFWQNCNNGLLFEGNYIDLFNSSDAMIHDSGSFTVEYLSTGKPILYLLNSSKSLDSLNEVGKMAVEKHYLAEIEDQISKFILDVIINGNDYMRNERKQYINSFLLPPNNTKASENIYNYIINEFKN